MTGHPLDQDAVLARFARAVEDGHGVLTDLDQHSGDGDYGDNLRAGVRLAVAAAGRGPQRGFGALGEVFLDEVGGTSGPLIGLLFQELARAHAAAPGQDAWPTGIHEGLAAIQRVGEAEPGDRTMVDALVPARDALRSGAGTRETAQAALGGARSTAALRARRGRASYVGERAVGHPDPGALGVALLFWSRARADGQAPGELTDHLPDLPAEAPPN